MPPFFFSQMVVTQSKPEHSNRSKCLMHYSMPPHKQAAGAPARRSDVHSSSFDLDDYVRSGHSTHYLSDSGRREPVAERYAPSPARAMLIPSEQPRKKCNLLLLRVRSLCRRRTAEPVADKGSTKMVRRPTRAVTPSSPLLPSIPEEED